MDNEALKIKLTELFPNGKLDEAPDPNGWWHLDITAADWPAMAATLRNDPTLNFDYLFCLTCVDWKTHLTMVYHLSSTQFRHTLVINSKLDRNNPEIGTVSDIWRTADFHEREVYEMFGVNFPGHPDLRLLILPDGWEGKNPMRKDFEDPVNMIRL
jgi:NADH-quinone oxidoreductase subunit C